MFGNWLKTAILMAGIMALFGAIGGMLGGAQGMILALLFGGAMNFIAYWNSDKLVLRLYNAQEVDEVSAPQLYRMVRELSQRASIPTPRVYVIKEDQPNAFATGRNPEHAAVAVTTGIMRILTERELRGVMAHELSHIKHRDILISTISAAVAGAISSLAQFGLLFGGSRSEDNEGGGNPILAILVMLIAPFAAMLIQFAISRSREFDADRGGAEISRDPQALATALEKISRYARGIPMAAAEAHPETAQMMILNPLSGGGLKGLFSTHPDTAERIERLMAMSRA
ncbi:MAG TPA: zinc metalloprotease HtpX [Burkholderiales bacterium]|nr:zinc metalloprotease HtpX [Burkholderiales bacterium]